MIIGTFTKAENAGFTGTLVTLTTRGTLAFEPKPKGADYTITLDGYEVGAAWKKTSREKGAPYLSVKLDSPFLPAPVFGALMPQDDGSHILVWNRPEPKQDD